MKNYLIILLFFAFVGCNQTTITQNDKENTKETELDSLYYAGLLLDSPCRVYTDSALLFINQLNLQKDTSFTFGYLEVDFFTKKDRFESFYLFKHSMDLCSKWYVYIATNQNGKYQILDSLEYGNLMYVQSIYLDDINFDGKNDIIIKYRIMSASRIVCAYNLITQENFKNVAYLYAMDSLYINPSKKEIIAFIDGGTFGPHEKSFYKWIDDSLTLIKYWTTSFDVMATKTTEKFIIKKGESIRVNYDTIHVEESGMDSLWYVID